ncbi:MAG: helix-turn-helix transcriptional regulator [Desulfurococcales archaeon]|nr:helix-turn-helix transcriptional regulator [Desulfurococcales archaeon]
MPIYDSVWDLLNALGCTFSEEEKALLHVRAQIGGQLLAYRARHKLTQKELAKRVGVSPVTISHIERGDTDVSLKTLVRICVKLGGKLKIDLGLDNAE